MRPVAAKWPKKSISAPRDQELISRRSTRIMSKEAPLSVAEHEFILDALRQDLRLDGRRADQFRPINISFGQEYGHVKLQLGKTKYVSMLHGSFFMTLGTQC